MVSLSRMLIGGATGFFGALTAHLFGVPEQAMLQNSLTRLFETTPLAGYALFTGLGVLLGLIRGIGRDSVP